MAVNQLTKASQTAQPFMHLDAQASVCQGFSVPFLAIGVQFAYIVRMLWRVRNSRGRPINAPAAFIHPCQPTVAKQPPTGSGWGQRRRRRSRKVHLILRHFAVNI
jgi:hypothetical protein